MIYKVRTCLFNKLDGNMHVVSFEKEIGAANEEQACKFMKESLSEFIKKGVIIETTVVKD